MKLGVFLDMYDDWNGTTCLNNCNLQLIVKGRTSDIVEDYADLLDDNVMSFGFYDDTLFIRLERA